MKKYLWIIAVSLGLYGLGCQSQNPDKPSEKETNAAFLVHDIPCLLGEGAIWNHLTGKLYFVDIEDAKLHILNPRTNALRSFDTQTRVGTVVPAQNGNAIVACQHGIFEMDLQNGEMSLLTDPEKEREDLRMNDGKCDPAGRLWVGSMHLDQTEHAAFLYRIEPDGAWSSVLDSITISNGLAWSLDEKTFFYIDTPTKKVQAFDYDKGSGQISNGRTAVEIPEELGYPDGMTIDEEGMLWIALWNGNSVGRWDPSTGKLLEQIEVPAHNITSCAFGGSRLDTLFITSARVDMSEEELNAFPLAGSIFAVVPGVKGVPAKFFNK